MLKRRKQVMGESDIANAQTGEPTLQKPLRLWPGVVIVVLQWLARFGIPIVVPDGALFGVMGGIFGGLAIVVWWAFFSRAPRSERWGAVVLMIIALVVTPRIIIHESIATAGMGITFFVYATPVLSLALIVWAVASRRLSDRPRRAAMVATILLACGVSFFVAVVVLALGPAIGEELVFRGVIGQGLIRARGVVTGVVITCLLFAAMHVFPPHALVHPNVVTNGRGQTPSR